MEIKDLQYLYNFKKLEEQYRYLKYQFSLYRAIQAVILDWWNTLQAT